MANNYMFQAGRLTTDRLLAYHLGRAIGQEDKDHDSIRNLEVMAASLAESMPRKVVSLSKLSAGKSLVVRSYTLCFEVDLTSVHLFISEASEEVAVQFTTFRRKKYGCLAAASCSPKFAVTALQWIKSNWAEITQVMQLNSGADVR